MDRPLGDRDGTPGTGGLRTTGRRHWSCAARAAFVAPKDLLIANRSGSQAGFEDFAGIGWTTELRALADASDIILLAVPPAAARGLRFDAAGKLIVSVMAGVDTAQLSAISGSSRVVRAMSNPRRRESRLAYSPFFAAPTVGAEDKSTVRGIFLACGATDEVPNERPDRRLHGCHRSGAWFRRFLRRRCPRMLSKMESIRSSPIAPCVSSSWPAAPACGLARFAGRPCAGDDRLCRNHRCRPQRHDVIRRSSRHRQWTRSRQAEGANASANRRRDDRLHARGEALCSFIRHYGTAQHRPDLPGADGRCHRRDASQHADRHDRHGNRRRAGMRARWTCPAGAFRDRCRPFPPALAG